VALLETLVEGKTVFLLELSGSGPCFAVGDDVPPERWREMALEDGTEFFSPDFSDAARRLAEVKR
jgi:hypothetical protein